MTARPITPHQAFQAFQLFDFLTTDETKTKPKMKGPHMKLEWRLDSFAESKFNQLGLSFPVQSVPLDKVNIGRHNNARGIALDEDLKLEYALAMERGSVFPHPVYAKLKNGRYDIYGGHHTSAAAEFAGASHVEAYVIINPDEFTEQHLPLVLNNGHGRKQDKKLNLNNALLAHKQGGKPLKELALLFDIKPEQIQEGLRIRKVQDVLSRTGINPASICDTALLQLHTLQGDPEIISTARLIKDKGLAGTAVSNLVKEVKSAPSEAQRMAVIARYEVGVPQANGTVKRKAEKTPWERMAPVILQLEGIIAGNTIKTLGIPTDKTDAARKQLYAIATKLRSLSGR